MTTPLELAITIRRLRESDLSPQLALAEALAEALATDGPERDSWLSMARDRLDRCHESNAKTRACVEEVTTILDSALERARARLHKGLGVGA